MDNDGKKKAGKNGKHSTRDLPVAAEGGSEGLLNPATAPRAREEAKHRGDNVTAV